MISESLEVTKLNYFPIKSCAAISPESVELTPTGIKNDRQLMFVKESKNPDEPFTFITQREIKDMALIKAEMDEKNLVLNAPGMPEISIARKFEGDLIYSNVWKYKGLAVDQGDQVAKWATNYLGNFLSGSYRLVQQSEIYSRKVNPERAISENKDQDIVSWADGYPLLLTSLFSLNYFNNLTNANGKMESFRANIEINGRKEFEEDSWKEISIGEDKIRFALVKACARCLMININQKTAERDQSTLKKLGSIRFSKEAKGVLFGMNLIQYLPKIGTLNIGDKIEVIS